MPQLVLGPLLRYVGKEEATVWVEADSACTVAVLDHECPTFEVEGHHYALVHLEGLESGSEHRYEVALDGERAWPPGDYELPPPVIRMHGDDDHDLRVSFGSCRVSLPHERPYTLTVDEDDRGREFDALYEAALRIARGEERPPDLLVLLGDQVYVDEGALETREFIRSRRDTSEPPGEEIADFEEYCHLYRESWTDPVIRWLLSTVPTAMVFDDHDVHDDWNISQAWVEEMRAQPWWHERIVGAYMSYWIYQHLGNLSPEALHEDEMWDRVRQADGDAGPMLREFAERSEREVEGTRWSYCRDFGRLRLVVIDSRAGRVFDPDDRNMLNEHEWSWLEDHMRGDYDHLLVASTLPFLLGRAMQEFEAWNEATCEGAWGSWFERHAESIRRALDVEHWGAFHQSFVRWTELVKAVARGERGEAPATVVALGGDVHHAYLAEVGFPREAQVKSAVYQAVCSPFRNPLSKREKLGIRFGFSRTGELIGRGLARAAGVREPPIRWRLAEGPYFDNQIATLDIDGRSALMRLEKVDAGEPEERALEVTFERRLA